MADFLDLVADEMSLADTFTSVEPEQDFQSDQGVEPSFTDCQVFPSASFRS